MTTEEKTVNQSKAQIYVAAYSDAQSMIDLAIEPTREHFNFIQAAITARNGYVARIEQKAVGYAVMSNSFFDHAYISHLFVHPDYRRQNIASMLIRYLENSATGDKLFTSTTPSNQPACKLLEKLGYQPSGQIENLKPHGCEHLYFKCLK
jgi:ribosomal protein S18 acetylase RimI-like enzyme